MIALGICLAVIGTFILIISMGNKLLGSEVGENLEAKSPVHSPAPKTPITITAEQLYAEYDENEVRADRLYEGKMLEISGVVDRVSVTFGEIELILNDGGAWSFVQVNCHFNDDQSESVAELNSGDKLVIMGKCRGKAIFPSLLNCTIISKS